MLEMNVAGHKPDLIVSGACGRQDVWGDTWLEVREHTQPVYIHQGRLTQREGEPQLAFLPQRKVCFQEN